jgi:hypothetical protein
MGAAFCEAVETGQYFGCMIRGLHVFKRFQDPSVLPYEVGNPGSQPDYEKIGHRDIECTAEFLLRVEQDIEGQTVTLPEFLVRGG